MMMARKKSAMEGLSDEMNKLVSQNLDFAPSCRWVRLVFTKVQQQLDHCLFKMAPLGIRTEESMSGAVAIKVHPKEPLEWDGVVLVASVCKEFADLKLLPRLQGTLLIPAEPIAKVLTMLSSVAPKAKLVPQQDLAKLAFRDLKKRKLASYNVICYNDQTQLKTAVELLKAANDIESQLEKISLPMLVLHGAADKVTDPMLSQFLYDKASSKDKTLKLY